MRVLYLVPDRGIPLFGTKGASVHVQSLSRAFALTGVETEVWGVHKGFSAPSDWPVSYRFFPALKEESLFIAQRGLSRSMLMAWEAAKDFSPDAILERYSLFSTVGQHLAKRLGVPHMLEVNAPLIRERATDPGFDRRASAQRVERRVAKAAPAPRRRPADNLKRPVPAYIEPGITH